MSLTPTEPRIVGVDALLLGQAALYGAALTGPGALAWTTSAAGVALIVGAAAVLTVSLLLEPPTRPNRRRGVDYPPLRRFGQAPD